MKTYKPNLNDIITLRKDLEMSDKASATEFKSPSKAKSSGMSYLSSGSNKISKDNTIIKKQAEVNIIQILQHELHLTKFSHKYVINYKYRQCTIRFIVVDKGIHKVCYEKIIFLGDGDKEKNEKFTVNAKRLKTNTAINCELDLENKLLKIGENDTFKASQDSVYRLAYTTKDTTKIKCDKHTRKFKDTGDDIYLDFYHANEEIDGIFVKPNNPNLLRIDGNTFRQDEVETLLLDSQNPDSEYLFVSVKGNLSFSDAFDQIIKHSKHMKSLLNEELKTRKIHFLLFFHLHESPKEFDNFETRRDCCVETYNQKNMEGICLSVFYLNTTKFFEEEYLINTDIPQKFMNDKVERLEREVGSLNTEVSSLKTEVSSLKTEVSSLKTEVSSLKTEMKTSMELEFGNFRRLLMCAFPNLVVDSSETQKELTEVKEVVASRPLIQGIGSMRTETAEAKKEDFDLVEEKEEYPLLFQDYGRMRSETAGANIEDDESVEEKQVQLSSRKKGRDTFK